MRVKLGRVGPFVKSFFQLFIVPIQKPVNYAAQGEDEQEDDEGDADDAGDNDNA